MKKGAKITIVDYGVGNLHSVVKAFKYFGQDTSISEEAEEILKSDAIILPGVGSFQAGIEGLKIRKLDKAIRDFAKTNKPILGICLGAQLLMSRGHEFGIFDGLGIIPGQVEVFKKIKDKIPHIGWNEVTAPKGVNWNKTILKAIKQHADLYFVHSYLLKPKNKKNVLSLTKYGGLEFCSAIYKDNVYGCQFHPEKSSVVGLKIIKNFIDLI